jgi:nucleotide-binding universal stress UspA family protein
MLKHIIVPVDFSEQAENALFFAAEISKRFSSLLTILHAHSNSDNTDLVKQKMNYLESKLKKSYESDLECKSILAPFDLIPALKSQVGTSETNLIVMGTKGASGLKKILIGSNTMRVIAELKIPILVIPEKVKFEDFNKKGKSRVVLATDLEETKNEAGFDFLSEFLHVIIHPKLRILNVRPKNTTLSYQQELKRSALLSSFGKEVETERITVFSNNVLDGINLYLDKNTDTGLVVMISRDSGGLFQRNFTQEMASITHHPLLVLIDRK